MEAQYHQFVDVLGALSLLVLLAMLVERALAVVFENDHYRRLLGGRGLRGILAVIVSGVLCHICEFDVLAVLFKKKADWVGMTFTGFVTAGGSAGVVAVVQGFLGFNRDTSDARIGARKASAQAAADIARFEADKQRDLAKAATDVAKAEADAKTATAQALVAEAKLREEAAKKASSDLRAKSPDDTGARS